jgi:hypothetical protein
LLLLRFVTAGCDGSFSAAAGFGVSASVAALVVGAEAFSGDAGFSAVALGGVLSVSASSSHEKSSSAPCWDAVCELMNMIGTTEYD